MNADATTSSRARVLPVWRDPQAWARTADVVAVLIALALPWSTSLFGIFVVVWMIAVVATLEPGAFTASLKNPISALPIALFAMAGVGTLWSGAQWGGRIGAGSSDDKSPGVTQRPCTPIG